MGRKITNECDAINTVACVKMPPKSMARALGAKFQSGAHGWRFHHSLFGLSPPREQAGYDTEEQAIGEFLKSIVYTLGSARDSLV